MGVEFSPWQQRAWDQIRTAMESDRMPHALLIGGPAALGKRALARQLAHRLMCSAPQQGLACGHCRNCNLLAAGTHPDLIEETLELNDKGEARKEILIAQVRRLNERLFLTPQIAAAQVALIHPAEALNRSAFNALLKTLEEPPPGRCLILVADQPQRLPATIRSRCQWLRMDLPPQAEALAWLRQHGFDARNSAEALEAAQGNPGLALQYLGGDGLTLRRELARDLAALSAGASAVELAAAWAADRPALRVLNGLDGPMRDDLQLAELLMAWQTLAA